MALTCLVFCPLRAGGQGVSAGLVQSLKGAGLTIDIDRGERFSTVSVAADWDGVLLGKTRKPGYRVSYLYNFRIGSAARRFQFFAGPGAAAGYLRDRDGEHGATFCLSGGAGVTADFPGGIRMSLSFTGDLGLHTRPRKGLHGSVLSLYQDGLARAFYPELRILHRFGGRSAAGTAAAAPAGRLTWGTEWGYYVSTLSKLRYSYRTADGFYQQGSVRESGTSCSGELLAYAGCNVLPWLNASVYAGYSGVYEDCRICPVSLRLTALRHAFLVLADFGRAVNRRDRVGWIAKCGAGCRIGLSERLAAEVKLIARAVLMHPELLDPGTGEPVPTADVFTSRRIAGSLGLSMALVLNR